MHFLKRVIKAISEKLNEPIIADRSLDLLSAFTWTSMALWGISSTITGLPTLTQATNPLYEFIWGCAIGILGSVAGVAALTTFIPTPEIWIRIRRKRVEFGAVFMLAGFTAVYPFLLFVLSVSGDTNRISLFFAAFSFCGLPIWRTFHLRRRMNALREVAKKGSIS